LPCAQFELVVGQTGATLKIMVQKATLDQLLELPPEERLSLVEDLWDSLAKDPTSVPVTETQAKELDARLAAYKADGNKGASWEEVKAQLSRKA
jgi:putative addiction module component (TIGR02574 family)